MATQRGSITADTTLRLWVQAGARCEYCNDYLLEDEFSGHSVNLGERAHIVGATDAALLEKIKPDWLDRYPGLRIRTDAALKPGDCQVRSRFGLTDARLQTKLTALERNLAPA